jgi:hypothetical protein
LAIIQKRFVSKKKKKKKSFPLAPRKQIPPCKTYGKLHGGECRKANRICYKCGELGPYQRSCPMNLAGGSKLQGSGFQQQNPAQARAYPLTSDGTEEEEYIDVASNTI